MVSPAKALDFESPLPTAKHSQPILIERSEKLIDLMVQKSPDELSIREYAKIAPLLYVQVGSAYYRCNA